jgi:isopenicillin N synthase-like dioxygenase
LVDLTGAFESGPSQDAAIDAIRRACEDVGFLMITGHGVPDSVLAAIDDTARQFFALPHEEKMHCAPGPGVFRGYTPPEGAALAQSRDVETAADLTEAFSINRFDDIEVARRSGLREGREGFFAPNIWPERPDGFKDVFEAYYAVMEDLANRLMGLMALALGLDEDWFDDKIRDHITNLTVNHYFALDGPPAPNQFRRGEHTDWGSVTILYHDGRPGLQIKPPNGEWENVPAVAGAFVVNLGDLMAAWTNDQWTSTLHRVVAPDGDTGDRLSIAFFHQPAYDARIECIPTCTSPEEPPRYPPTTSGEWILSMLRKIQLSSE